VSARAKSRLIMSEHRNERQRMRSGANLSDERSREEQVDR
jgi:hypothetical protein